MSDLRYENDQRFHEMRHAQAEVLTMYVLRAKDDRVSSVDFTIIMHIAMKSRLIAVYI